MNLLLDTCAILFLSVGHPCVAVSTRAHLQRAERVWISPISAAELACLWERDRIRLPKHWKPWLREAIQHNGWEVLPITFEIMEEAYSLPGSFHADRADRILAATARVEKLRLLTTDRKMLDYPHVAAAW